MDQKRIEYTLPKVKFVAFHSFVSSSLTEQNIIPYVLSGSIIDHFSIGNFTLTSGLRHHNEILNPLLIILTQPHDSIIQNVDLLLQF